MVNWGLLMGLEELLMILWLTEASHHLGCTKIFKEPSNFGWSDYYEDHFMLPQPRIVMITNKTVMLLQFNALDNLDKKPSNYVGHLLGGVACVELAKARRPQPSHLILHFNSFKRPELFVRVIKCKPVRTVGGHNLFSSAEMWKTNQFDMKSFTLKVINTEWGNYNSQYIPFRDYDRAIDLDSPNQHKQVFSYLNGGGAIKSTERAFTSR
ncbi:uncharacterized protein LOC141623662 isoform X2 [Silene latifolia]|uniref:uncharacterized protein LOC141623662 isoform X2 n=1 Tax=Silene latifolia TaxID=37657 RepID=UPI003D771193